MAGSNDREQEALLNALAHTTVSVNESEYSIVKIPDVRILSDRNIEYVSVVVDGEAVIAVIPASDVNRLPSGKIKILSGKLGLVSLRAGAGKPSGYLASVLDALARHGLTGRHFSSITGEHALFSAESVEQAVRVITQLIESSQQECRQSTDQPSR